MAKNKEIGKEGKPEPEKENIENLLDKGAFLAREHLFILSKGEMGCNIVIQEALSDSMIHKFTAIPVIYTLNKPGHEEYVGYGNSIEEALRDCLKKIKGKSFDQIFPKE